MTNQSKILIVEDEIFLLDIYVETLTDAGYQVDTAQNGSQALKKMTKGGYDLILLDVMLPEKDGKQIVAHLQKHPPKSPNKKIVFTTNLAQETLTQEEQKIKVDGYIIKSDRTPDQFLEDVKKYLS